MNPWPFVAAAYSVTFLLTFGLLAWSYRTMRSAEVAADSLRRK